MLFWEELPLDNMAGNMDIDIDINDTKLKEMLEKVKQTIGVKVGILGANGIKIVKTKDGKESKERLTEATLGAIHEYGSKKRNIPSRSFLRMPIQKEFRNKIVKNSKFKDALQRMTIEEINGHIGETSVAIVNEAFATGGFGEWAPLAEETIKRKGSDMILVDTGDLEHSITYEDLH